MATEKKRLEGAQNRDETAAAERRARQLAELLERHRGERHAIVLQDYPDPDAISSSLAHRLSCARFEIEADLLYEGRISHQENQALVRLLEIPLIRVSEGTDLKAYRHSVFVDNQGTTSSLTARLAELGIEPLIIVDHHEPQEVVRAEFEDIRKVGATATIYTEYLRDGLLTLDRSDPQHVQLATALMHGLRSETSGLVHARVEDMEAATFLTPFIDAALLDEILHIKRSKRVLDIIRDALANRVIIENHSISGVGYLRSEDRDAIPQAADFLITEENVHTTIVYGIVLRKGAEAAIGSMRTTKLTLDVDEFLKEALGGIKHGHYYCGGRRGAGGFEIPIKFLAGEFDEKLMVRKWKIYDEIIKRKLLAKIGVSSPQSATQKE